MTWSLETSNGYESKKIKYLLPQYTRGRVLEIGCGKEKAYDHFIGYDSGHHFGKAAADVTGDAADLSLFADESFDAVFSSHVLEHMADMGAALKEWSRVIKVGGFLCLYVPSANLYPKVGEEGANPDHKADIYPETLTEMVSHTPGAWIQQEFEERGQENEYSIFAVYKKTDSSSPVGLLQLPTLKETYAKTACIVRYGGFGDMLQAASILPALKKEGFHVTMMTTPEGKEMVKYDPNIDAWLLQDKDQVPNGELPYYWQEQAKRFDRFVNLSESIEGTLLALPGRTTHAWPKEIRHRYMNRNYFDWTAELAGVQFKPCKQFYPSAAEMDTAGERIKKGAYNIVWALAGSSVHKFYPHMDAIIARIMLDIPNCNLILTGDMACKILESGWEEEPRIQCLSGEIGIRETLTLAQMADLVIGPETGVLNSVAHEPNGKVVMLSHSSKKNLSQHWYNCETMTPDNTPCYPCHMMHYGTEFCHTEAESGAALCQQNISPAKVWDAIKRLHDKWSKK